MRRSRARRPTCAAASTTVTFEWIPREREQARRPARQRGDGPRRRARRPVPRRSRPRPADRASVGAADGQRDPADARPARLDRALGRAALLRPQRACRSTTSGARRRPRSPRATFGDGRRRGQLTAARARSRPPRRSPPRSGWTVETRRPRRDRLREWEGRTHRPRSAPRPRALDRVAGSPDVAPPGGESFAAVGRRVRRAREAIIAAHPERDGRRRHARDADQDAGPLRARRAAVDAVPACTSTPRRCRRSTTSPTATRRCVWSTTPTPPAHALRHERSSDALDTTDRSHAEPSSAAVATTSRTGTVSRPSRWNSRGPRLVAPRAAAGATAAWRASRGRSRSGRC